MKNLITIITAGILLLLLAIYTYRSGTAERLFYALEKNQEPKVISVNETDLFPEGIDYDKKNDRFLLSSLTRGTIGQVKNGSYSKWVDDKDLISTVGIHVDRQRGRVLVAVADPGTSPGSSEATLRKLAAVAAYDLEGQRLFYTDLAILNPEALHFPNDLTTDTEGNTYVTDSYNGTIYKVDKTGKASVFYRAPVLAPLFPGGIGLNGIDYHSGGYLLVSKMDEAAILKIPLKDPGNHTRVKIDVKMYNPDGLYLKSPQELLVVSNGSGGETGRLHTLVSTDNWKSAAQKSEFYSPGVFPTTVTVKGNTPYVVYAFLHMLGSGEPQADFSIVRAIAE